GAGGGLLKGPFDKTEMTFEVSGYLPGGLFMEWSGVISQDGASFDGTWVVWQDTKQLGSGALSGERADFPWGDADCDGESNSIDAQLVLQEVAGLSSLPECGLFADASFDGNRNAYDAAIILQYEAGLLESLPVLPTETP
ncbi:MAG: dockerin type I repeat-containing protein, partial [Dehalococcoidia bacterium]|nr:dockerin type I repeat-containing protein [Dehalococcoidia bacterium]